MSAEETNKVLVRRFVEAQANADLNTLDELLAPDFVDHSLQPDQDPGREGFIRSVAKEPTIFSNVRANIEDQVAQGNKVITRLTMKRLHDRGEFLGLAPTGMEIKTSAIVIHRIERGKIAEEWSESTGALEATRQRLEQEMIERERAEQELQVARRIQQASLPREVPQLEGWQINPYFRPAREVGGDFYEFFELPNGQLGFAVGDATGKGVPAALVMTATCAFLGGVATASGSSPGEVLAQVNEAVLARIPANMFVTCFYGVLDPSSGRFSYANAGHNLPCCCHVEGASTELKARGMPLGLMPGMSYEEHETILTVGECVLFYTDGLTEAHNSQGEMFGTPRLRSLLSDRFESRRDLSAALVRELRRFTGEGWEQEDDITLLTLQRSAARR
jgi:serine phosphatase RsbU (regulator of sigma subunit)/ketosteroid isomerase-like protein